MIDVRDVSEYYDNDSIVATICIYGSGRKDSINKYYFHRSSLPEPLYYRLKTNKIYNFDQFRELIGYAYKTVSTTEFQCQTEQKRKQNLEKIREIQKLLQ